MVKLNLFLLIFPFYIHFNFCQKKKKKKKKKKKDQKPPVGQELNRPAIIRINKCYPLQGFPFTSLFFFLFTKKTKILQI